MPLNLFRRLHRDETGSAGMEMVLVLPLYASLIYSVFTVGDLVLQSEKVQAAAYYCAFKREAVAPATINSTYFVRSGTRAQVVSIEDPTGSKNAYPKLPFPDGTMLDLRSIDRSSTVITNTNNSDKATAETVMAIALEGSVAPPWFGMAAFSGNREGGGWVVQRKAAVNVRYRQMFPFKNVWGLYAGCVTLNGNTYSTKIPRSLANLEVWDFRDERAWNYYKEGPNPIYKPYTNSGWNAGLFTELKPTVSPKMEPDPFFLVPPLIEFKQPWAELPYGDYDGMPVHKVG